MKHIYRLLASAILLIITAACYNEEIETPQSPDQQQSDFRITASIIQTRVAYDYSDLEKVTQEWEEGDILFGFYGGVTSNQIVFEVSDVDSNTGVATLEAVSDADWIEEATEGGTQVDLVYTGGEASFTDSGINVDLSGQSLDRVPGCMHAQATLQVDEDGNKSLEFNFQNDCALIEIDSLTGIADAMIYGELDSVTITNLLLHGSYSFSNGELVFASDDTLNDNYTIDLPSGWTVGADGTVSGPNKADKVKILIAVAPNPDEYEIKVTAKVNFGPSSPSISYSYGERSLAGGLCYVISAKPIVAKTADGQYFTTVTGAFGHAKDLSENSSYGSADENIVTLLKDCGLAGIDANGESVVGESAPIDIDGYNVTLDLNGKTLELGDDECFRVNCDEEDERTENTNIFTIKDSGVGGGIESFADYMVKSFGKVNINSGTFTSTDSYGMVLNGDTGVLTIKDGTLQSNDCCVVENYGTLNVEGGDISSTGNFTIDCSYGEGANISGGIIHCDDYEAISITGELYISGGTIESENYLAISGLPDIIDISGECTITSVANVAISVENTQFHMSDGEITGALGGILLSGASKCTISDGSIESENGYALYVENSQCEVSGGTIKSESTTKPAVYCFTDADHKKYFSALSPNLLITWPEEGESAGGPLIVSSAAASDGKSFGAVSTANAIDENTFEEKTNYAIVEISGGYLYSSDGAFCSKAGNSTLLFTGPFYTNIGVQEEDNPVKSQYYDFSKGTYECVPSKTATKTNGVYSFGFEIISDTWTYVIDNCSQTKTAIGADEEVTYSFRSYKQKGTEKEPVPWKAQMRVAGDDNEWHYNHSYGPLNGWHWTTSRDDKLGNADKGDGSIDTNEEYIIKFMSTKSDTYTVRIIASDAGGSITYTFAPVVQTISSTPSTDPTVTELWNGSTTEVSISSTDFNNASPRIGCMLRVYAEVNQQNNPINTITCTLVAGANGDNQQPEEFTDDGFVEFEIAETLYDVICSYGCKFVIYYGANITKVELIQ